MSRYIDADKFAKQAYEVAYPIVHDINSHERGLTLMGIAQLLDEQPTADVVEVVRCKDCKYHAEFSSKCNKLHLTPMRPNDYCSYGERRE